MAEAIGVSRVWYAMLESDAELRASPGLLNRLAKALALSDVDRDTLFRLALPELSTSDSYLAHEDPSAFLEPLRATAKRLQNATDQSEVLQMAAEAIAQLFGEAEVVGAFRQMDPGRWSFPVMLAQTQVSVTLADIRAKLQDAFTAEHAEEVILRGAETELRLAGAPLESLHHAMKPRFENALERAELLRENFIYGHVNSRDGCSGTLFALNLTRDKEFTELNRSLFGLVVDLASLAISSRAPSSTFRGAPKTLRTDIAAPVEKP